jgi:hypothetical protein
MSELKPCPFCGNTEPLVMGASDGWYVVCDMPETCCVKSGYDTREEAIAAWNRRDTSDLRKLEDRLFALGEMAKGPCFVCGYNGPNYFQPDVHKCAERHHKLYKRGE